MFARFGRWAALSASIIVIASAPTPALAAGGDVITRLTLDTAFTGAGGKTITDEPPAIRNCARIPGGSRPVTDGWRFDQPLTGHYAAAYTVAFITTVQGTLTPILLGVTSAGVVQIKITQATLGGQFGPDDVIPAPAGVTGALLDNGAGGAWLGTPHGWRLAAGAMIVPGSATGPATFALTAVCLPKVDSSPSPSHSASVSPSSSASASPGATAGPTASAQPAPPAAGLPITGDRTAALALAGLLAVALGVLLLAIRRRRDKIRFQA